MAFREEQKPKTGFHWLSLMGSCASILCVIHCFGTALLSLFAPAIIHMIPHSQIAEIGIWVFASFCAVFAFWRLSPPLSVWIPLLILIVGGSYFFASHWHIESSIALFLMATYQLIVLGFFHFRKSGKAPPCCQSETSPKGL